MITADKQRIETLTRAGHWGSDTLHSMLRQYAEKRGQDLAVKDQPNRRELTGDEQQSLSWTALQHASENLAIALQSNGVSEDDRVIIQLPNIVELLVMYYAISKLGAIASPVPIQYGSHELQHIATTLGAQFLITLDHFRDTPLAANARAALPGLTTLAFGQELTLDTSAAGTLKNAPDEDANRVLTICWTSGTSGTPKGVPRSHNLWLASGRATMTAGSYAPDDRLLNPFPMVNMSALGGFVFPAAQLGCALVLHHPLDPPLFLQQMQEEEISFTIAPPALLNQLAKTPELWNRYNFGDLRRVGSGSAPLSPGMIETFSRDFGVEVVNFYGSNEGISLFSTPESAPSPEVRASMFSRPVVGTGLETRVANPDTGQLISQAGEEGELQVRGATVFDGYFQHDNSDVFADDGYFRTGDLVEICGEQGEFYRIVGRCKDIINRGGMKISPVELDIVLEQHPDLAEAAVCAYPDERLGEKICACLVMQPGADSLTVSDLQDYLLQAGLAKFKLPERIEIMDKLPRNALGKVQRFVLQDAINTTPDDPDS